MSYLKNIKLFILLILFIFSTKSFSQFSKTHYIPPIATTGQGAADALDQFIYISTPNENPFNVTITSVLFDMLEVSLYEVNEVPSKLFAVIVAIEVLIITGAIQGSSSIGAV